HRQMSGFEKISLGSQDFARKDTNSSRPMGRRKVKINRRVLAFTSIFLLCLILFVIFGIVLPVGAAYKQVQKTIAQAKIAAADIKQQNVESASSDLKKTQIELVLTQKDLAGMWYMRFIPVANW